MSFSEMRACVVEIKRPLKFHRLPLALKRLMLSIGTFGADVEPRPVPQAHTILADFPVADTFNVTDLSLIHI